VRPLHEPGLDDKSQNGGATSPAMQVGYPRWAISAIAKRAAPLVEIGSEARVTMRQQSAAEPGALRDDVALSAWAMRAARPWEGRGR
jgi:hypothetical protein